MAKGGAGTGRVRAAMSLPSPQHPPNLLAAALPRFSPAKLHLPAACLAPGQPWLLAPPQCACRPVPPAGGEFPHVTPPYCKQLLTQYSAPSSGAYWREVTAAAQSAIAALGLNPESGGGDDDDAELAAPPRQLPGSRRGAAGGGGGRSPAAAANSSSSSSSSSSGRGWRGASNPVFVFDIDETALSNLPDISLPHWPAARQLAAAPRSAPPLKPVLRLYRALHAAGISLAFVTGRGEEGRADTAANLRAAGYGGACDGSDGSRVRPPVPPGAAGQRGGAQQEEPCYVLLMLRPPGEDRLASVYK